MKCSAEEGYKLAMAHVRRTEDGSCEIHDLEDHLRDEGNMSWQDQTLNGVRRGLAPAAGEVPVPVVEVSKKRLGREKV